MPFNDAQLGELVFGASADALPPLKLQSQQDAVNFLRSIFTSRRGARLLYGPALSGKSTIVRRFVRTLSRDVAVAIVDGSGLAAKEFLSRILAQFGYDADLSVADEHLRFINVFAIQQTQAVQSPLIVVENIENMRADALHALSMLASMMFQGRFAVRIVLTGGSEAPLVLKSEGMAPISQRTVSMFKVAPLSPIEAMLYLHGRLRACGVDEVLPVYVCGGLNVMSRGLPGLLNQHAKGVLGQAISLPVSEADVRRYQKMEREKPPAPRLIVTNIGEIVEEYVFNEKKVTIGRSSLADIVIYGEHASKFHTLLLLYADALILVDLNSTNGTFVNSVRVNSTILRSNDIISLASHRIKVLDAPVADLGTHYEIITSDTSKMKTLTEMRQQKKRQQLRFVSGGKEREL